MEGGDSIMRNWKLNKHKQNGRRVKIRNFIEDVI